MALIVSAASGNFNAGATWVGGVVPTVGDEARASDTHTITITANATCDEVSNAGTGIFTLNSGVTLTANVTSKSTTITRNCLQFTAASPATATIVGNCTGGTVSTAVAVANTSTGSLTITGNCIGGSGGSAHGANNNSTGTLTITGNCTGGSGASTFGANNASSGTMTITGNATGGSSSNTNGANNNSTGTLTITGNCTGGSGAAAHGASNASTGTLTITGNCTGGSGGGAFGANNNSTGTMTVVGTINASEFNYGVGGPNRGQVTLLTGPFIASTTFGVNPIGCLSWRWAASLNNQTYITVPTNNLLATRNLVTPDNATNFPAASNVRSAITYGIGGALTGTCAVPPAGSVAFGVPVDNTTGTATLSAAQIWDYALSAITSSNTIGTLLKTNIDATISSRSTATTAGIADAVWDEVMSDHTINGTYGDRIVRSLNSNNTLQLTGSHHAAADVHEFQPDVITNDAIAASAVTEIATGVRTELATELTAITELHLIHGLKSGSTLTVTPTSRSAGAVSQTIGGDGTTSTTVSRD